MTQTTIHVAQEQFIEEDQSKDLLRFVTAGSVDDGKSTLIGRLLVESKGIYEDQIDAVRNVSSKGQAASEGFDLALLTDGLKAEREQGITIDVAHRFFSTPKRKFIIADCPGHEQYTRNMATGSSTADLAIILIDAENGVITQSKRHTFICSLLAIPHIVVCVNKMDLVDYSKERFDQIRADFRDFSAKLEVSDVVFIPVSALNGDNVVDPSPKMPWYKGTTLLNHLENVHIASDRNLIDMRYPVQVVSRPDRTFRGFMGTLASGIVRPGDEVVVLPSKQRTKVKDVIGPDGPVAEGFPPLSLTLTTEEEVDISRGDMLAHPNNQPHVERRLDAMVVWMNPEPMRIGKKYLIKHTTRTVTGSITRLQYQIDVNTLHKSSEAEGLELNEIGRCRLELNHPLYFDAYTKNRETGSFIIIDRINNNTVGAGMILDRNPRDLEREETGAVDSAGGVTREERERLLQQAGRTVWLEGDGDDSVIELARRLERKMHNDGKLTYALTDHDGGPDCAKKLAERAKLLNDAGVIVLIAAPAPNANDPSDAAEVLGSTPLWIALGEGRKSPDLQLNLETSSLDECADAVLRQFESKLGYTWYEI